MGLQSLDAIVPASPHSSALYILDSYVLPFLDKCINSTLKLSNTDEGFIPETIVCCIVRLYLCPYISLCDCVISDIVKYLFTMYVLFTFVV